MTSVVTSSITSMSSFGDTPDEALEKDIDKYRNQEDILSKGDAD